MPRLIVDFMDGTQQVFEVPKPTDPVMARRVRLEMLLEGRFLIIEEGTLENAVLFFPIENIRSIRAEGNAPGLELPPYAVRNATRIS